ncbi:HAD hydrolase family protein [Peribacillus cavernae]|uniref:HAD hydrolase family protein n=1 Tax=Peribacillus cavernae TaxID=1674310 RepID=UPI002482FB4A|nr:HAD hydrolase family protein [Peribacillus cavernae]MDQ0220739.1 HAD superfamily hydrolase (TIGR01484 family) [Peribacillus cavernae]
MCKYKLLFLDIDGTIMRPDNTIEQSTKIAVFQAQQKGIEVVLATGRPLHEIANIAEELHVKSFIGYNGAYCIYNQKDIFKEPMNRKSVRYFVDTAIIKRHELVLYTSEKNILTTLDSEPMKQFVAEFQLNKNEIITPSVIDNILAMTIITDSEIGDSHYKIDDSIHLSQVQGMNHCFDGNQRQCK